MKVLVDQGFKDEVIIYGAALGIAVEQVKRAPGSHGFVPQAKRWMAEQTNGTLLLHRRLAGDYEHRPDNSASRVYWAPTAIMVRRLTTPTPRWRDDLSVPTLSGLMPSMAFRAVASSACRASTLANSSARRVIWLRRSVTVSVAASRTEAESPTAYQHLLTFFNDHPGQPFRARELHEHLDLPTDEATVNVTRSRLGRLVRQGHLTRPGRGLYQRKA